MDIAILGAGAWGTALAISFSSAGSHRVALWTRRPQDARRIAAERESAYLPGCAIPASVALEHDLARVAAAELVVVATSTAGLRPVARELARLRPDCRLLWACKGFDAETGQLPHEVVAEVLPHARASGALSGPSFALEVAQGLPTALVLASADRPFAAATAAALNGARLRIYSSDDVVGVELGGAVKNVIAIAAGIGDGLGLGLNARSALITRGLAEMTRLGLSMAARPATFAGLAGLGDLVLTCTGALSRNREVGLQLAAGRPLAGILSALGHVAEGVNSASAVRRLAAARGIEMPIATAVHDILFAGKPPRDAVESLLARDPKPEEVVPELRR